MNRRCGADPGGPVDIIFIRQIVRIEDQECVELFQTVPAAAQGPGRRCTGHISHLIREESHHSAKNMKILVLSGWFLLTNQEKSITL